MNYFQLGFFSLSTAFSVPRQIAGEGVCSGKKSNYFEKNVYNLLASSSGEHWKKKFFLHRVQLGSISKSTFCCRWMAEHTAIVYFVRHI